jgi:hypothetical protein
VTPAARCSSERSPTTDDHPPRHRSVHQARPARHLIAAAAPRQHYVVERLNTYLMRWAGRKYKRLQTYKRFKAWWVGIRDRDPDLFAHWRWTRNYA